MIKYFYLKKSNWYFMNVKKSNLKSNCYFKNVKNLFENPIDILKNLKTPVDSRFCQKSNWTTTQTLPIPSLHHHLAEQGRKPSR